MKRLIRNNSRALRAFPELAYFDDLEERTAAYHTAFRRIQLRQVLVFIPCNVIGMLGIPWFVTRGLAHLGISTGPLSRSVIAGISGSAVAVTLGILTIRLFRQRLQRSLREQLVARGTPICIACGYDLRGQVEARCPECGRPFDASLLKNPPFVPPW